MTELVHCTLSDLTTGPAPEAGGRSGSLPLLVAHRIEMRFAVRGLLLLFLSLVAGCALAPDAAHRFEAGLQLGIDPLEEQVSWRPGDRAVFEVRYFDGAARRHWWVELELLPLGDTYEVASMSISFDHGGQRIELTERSPLHPAVVRVWEEGVGAPRVESVALPVQHLGRGLHPICERANGWALELADGPRGAEHAAQDRETSEAWAREFGGGIAILMSFYKVIEASDVLTGVLRNVVRTPSLLSMAFRLGVHTMIRPEFEAVRPAPSPLTGEAGALSAYTLPGTLDLNGSPALEYEILCVPALPPLHMSGGVVRLEGRHPGRADRRVEIELVAASRGPGPARRP